MNSKHIYLKLGTNCNLHCKYCHSTKYKLEFNKKILPYLKQLNLSTITFGGGEPLLYFDLIKEIIEYLNDDNIDYAFVTNGTLLNDEIVDFINKHDIKVMISFDGLKGSQRDMSKTIGWTYFKKIHRRGTAITFYNENSNIEQIINDFRYSCYDDKLKNTSDFGINFVHSTKDTGILSTDELAKSFILQVCTKLEYEIRNFAHYNSRTVFLANMFKNYCLKKKPIIGVKCCSNNVLYMGISGEIFHCPYTYEPVGNIFDGVDYKEIEKKYKPEKCQHCELWDVCHNYCHVNITDHECYIMHKINKHFYKLMDKYNVTYDQLKEALTPITKQQLNELRKVNKID